MVVGPVTGLGPHGIPQVTPDSLHAHVPVNGSLIDKEVLPPPHVKTLPSVLDITRLDGEALSRKRHEANAIGQQEVFVVEEASWQITVTGA